MPPVFTPRVSFNLTTSAGAAPHSPAFVDDVGSVSFTDLCGEAPRWLTRLAELGLDLAAPLPVAFVAHSNRNTLALIATLLHAQIPLLPLHPRWQASDCTQALAGKPGHLLLPSDWAESLPQQPSAAALAAFQASSQRSPDATALAAILFTSGTSGAAKGVCLSADAFVESALASAANLNWQAQDRWLLNLPLSHIGGLSVVTRCLLAQKPCVLPPPQLSHDPEAFLDWVRTSQTTLFSLVPTQLERFLRADTTRLPASVRALLVGGAPLSPALERRALERGWPILPTYGLTEACSQVATRAPGGLVGATPVGSVGRALGHIEMRLVAQQLELRGPSLLQGYWGEPQRAPAAWFPTADLGTIDRDGNLFVHGRADDTLITGGEKVQPTEIEDVLRAFPGIENACVFGLKDPEWGEALACVVTPQSSDWSALLQYLAASLPGFKRPKWITSTTHLPLNANGKLARQRIPELFSAQLQALK